MLNHITIMGRLTADPELRRTSNGVSVASFTLAVDRDRRDKETGERDADFIRCTAWRYTAEFVSKYFAKGQMAVVSGRLRMDLYTDQQGNKRTSAEVQVDKAAMRGKVVYVHPEGRYHTVEFMTAGGPIRESFQGAGK